MVFFMWLCRPLFFSAFCFFLMPFFLHAVAVNRVILAFYDDSVTEESDSETFQFAETPLEFLGYYVKYLPLSKEFPPIHEKDGVQGIIVWDLQNIGDAFEEKIMNFLTKALELKKKLLILGSLPLVETSLGIGVQTEKFFRQLGVEFSDRWIVETTGYDILAKDPHFINFEKEYEKPLNPFPIVTLDPKKGIHPWVTAYSKKDKRSYPIAFIGDFGGYIAPGFALFTKNIGGKEVRKWHINPFTFLLKSLGGEKLPKPDVTTLFGNRIFYSQIDGDGWNNISELTLPNTNWALCSEVILEKLLKDYPNTPFTVAPIAADLDPKWVGSKISTDIAKQAFLLDNVEAGSHTYSHPFDWHFFEHYTPEEEYPYLSKYPYGNFRDKTFFSTLLAYLGIKNDWNHRLMATEFHYPKKTLESGYSIPRAYANHPFDIHQEIGGAVDFLNSLCPEGKRVRVLQWSGDSNPFREALLLAKEMKIENINGGNTRFDSEFPSYTWVRPLSRNIDALRQPFASMSNENEYTELWTTRFFGFNKLPATWKNTNTPIRLRPMNLYFHIYSGEKQASFLALIENLHFALQQDIIPIETSRFAKMVRSFYTIRFEELNENSFLVKNKGNLGTLRFDRAALKGVDFSSSKGVIGQRHIHGSLYVFLDDASKDPVVSLKKIAPVSREPIEDIIYVAASNYRVISSEVGGHDAFSAELEGIGPCKMEFIVDGTIDTVWMIKTKKQDLNIEHKAQAQEGILRIDLPLEGKNHLELFITKELSFIN